MVVSVFMAELSWPEWGQKIAAGAINFIPIGATDQLGPHLPLNVEVILPAAVCKRVARLTGGIVAPTIAPGTGTPSHGGFLYYEILELLTGLAKRGHIAGVDLVEIAADYDPAAVTAILAAQLPLNLLGRMFT